MQPLFFFPSIHFIAAVHGEEKKKEEEEEREREK